MNDFVDPKSRSVTLPEGCKDLVELLRQARPADEPVFIGWPGSSLRPRPRIREIPISDLPNVVRFIFEPGPRRRSAIICTPGERELIALSWNQEQSAIVAILCFPENAGMRAKARKFLAALGKQSSPPRRESWQRGELKLKDLLNYDPFAASELELNVLLRRFFHEFLNLAPDSRLTCVVSRPDQGTASVSGTAQS